MTIKYTLKASVAEAGSIATRNRKMPGSSFAITVKECGVGSKLMDVPGSVCEGCYANKIERMYPSVHQGWTNNYLKATKLIATNPEQWAKAMAFQIHRAAAKTGENYHRWFDAGDVQSVEMLIAIAETAKLTPTIWHWVPTREGKLKKAFEKAYGPAPANMIVRMSSTMIGDAPMAGHEHTSTVHREGETVHGFSCPAYTAKHRALSPTGKDMFCGPCRKCWERETPNVSYPYH